LTTAIRNLPEIVGTLQVPAPTEDCIPTRFFGLLTDEFAEVLEPKLHQKNVTLAQATINNKKQQECYIKQKANLRQKIIILFKRN